MPEISYYLGYCFWVNDEIGEAINALRANYAINDPRCNVILGLCYLEDPRDPDKLRKANAAKPLVEKIDIVDIEDDNVVHIAYLKLCSMYNGVYGSGGNIYEDETIAGKYAFRGLQRLEMLGSRRADKMREITAHFRPNGRGGYRWVDN